MNVRRATIEDAALLARLKAPALQRPAGYRPDVLKPVVFDTALVQFYVQLLGEPDNHIFIGEVDGVPVGYVYAVVRHRPQTPISYPFDLVYVDQILLDPDARRHGYGRQLLQAVYDLARSMNIHKVMLDTWTFNNVALLFFKHDSFLTINERVP